MSERKWAEWVPAWSKRADGTPIVVGKYEERDPEEPGQRVEATCLECGATFQALCTSGNPRPHIAKFAVVHKTEHEFGGRKVP